MLLVVSLSFAHNRSDAENKCRSNCSVDRSECRVTCFDEHKKDSTYVGMNQCQNKCNTISNKCKDASVPS